METPGIFSYHETDPSFDAVLIEMVKVNVDPPQNDGVASQALNLPKAIFKYRST